MRLTPLTPPHRFAATAGAILATTVLLAGCDSESADDATSVDEESWTDWFSSDDGSGDGGDSEQADGEEESQQDEESWTDWFSFDDESDQGGDEGSGNEQESGEDSSENADSEEENGDQAALPESCADAGAEEIAAGLAPQGATVAENSGGIDGASDAEQLSCVWSGGSGDESFALVFSKSSDPSARLDVAQLPGQEDMNWEVDIDVNVDNYRTARADEFGGELDYVATVEGSTKSLHLSLPDDLYVSAISVSSDAEKADLEDAVYQAAERTT